MALWTPAEIISDLDLWLDVADDTTYSESSGVITGLTDKANNASPTKTGNPLVIQNELNGLPILRFNGTSDRFNYPLAVRQRYQNKPVIWSIAIVKKRGSDASNAERPILFVSTTSNASRFLQSFGSGASENDTVTGGRRLDSDSFNGIFNTSQTRVDEWITHYGINNYQSRTINLSVNAGSETHSLNNQWGGSGNCSNTTPINVVIGANSSANNHGDIDLAEIISGTSALSTGDLEKIEGYLAWKWGIEGNLPSNHPYKNEAPEIDPVIPPEGEVGEGDLDALSQQVGIIAEGDLDALEQAVDLRITVSGDLDSIAQTVNTAASGDLDRLAQSVRDATVSPPPFDLELIIGSVAIPCNQIHGSISITRSESSAALMDVTLIPPKGMQNITQYQGKNIILNYIEGNQSTRIYTGKVDIPEIDILGQTITLRCTDNRTEQNNALPKSFVQGVGIYSDAVFGEAKDQNDEIEKRLRTVQASLDYDANGLVTYTDWTPKATPDFVFDDPKIYRRTPRVEVLSRGRVINKVNLDLTYRWVRLRHRERDWEWEFVDTNRNWCLYLENPVSLLHADGPLKAAESTGWSVKNGTYKTTGLADSGWYRCGTQIQGWSVVRRSCDTQQKTDSDGNPVTDSSGNNITEAVNCSITNYQNTYATRAEWTAAKRWAQTVEQKVNYVIEAPQSIAQYGVVERDERAGVESDFDAQPWESMTNYQQPPQNAVVSPNGDWVLDQDNLGGADFTNAAQCAISKAVADIRGSHRQNYVTLQLPMQPSLDLRHTVETTAGKIKCKGKVYQVRHIIDVGDKFAETEVQIALSRSEGSASTFLPWPELSPPVDQPNTPSKFRLGNWIGGRTPIRYVGPAEGGNIDRTDTTEAGLPKGAQGFITNFSFRRTGPLFTVSFIVDTPSIEDAARDLFVTESEQQNTVAIRNDLLEVTFDE